MSDRPNENERWSGEITISLEVVLDENPERLAEDMAALVARAMADRPAQNDVWLWGAKIREVTGTGP